MQKAHAYLDQKQPALAIPEFQAAVVLDPSSVDAQANLGVLLFFQGKAADSIPHFRAALEQQPSLAKIQGLLGMAESRTLDFADARKDMEAALPAIPRSALSAATWPRIDRPRYRKRRSGKGFDCCRAIAQDAA